MSQTGLNAELQRPRSRIAYIDLVRFAGLLLVVAGHVWTQYPLSGYVAVFFVITGYLWKPGRSVRQEASHRTRTLLIPYASWLLVLGVIYLSTLAIQGASGPNLARKAAALVWGGEKATQPFTAFWFMTAIFVAAVIYRAMTSTQRWRYILVLIASIVSASWLGGLFADLPLAIGNGFCCLAFIAGGHGLRKIQNRIPAPWATALLVLAVCLTLILTGLSRRLTLKSGDYGIPLLGLAVSIGISSAAILLASYLGPHISARVGRMVTLLVSMSTPIILLHTVPLWLLEDSGLSQWVKFIFCLAFPIAVGSALLYSPEKIKTLLMPGPVQPRG